MRTKHTCIFVFWSSIRLKVKFRTSKTGLSRVFVSTDRSEAVPLLHFFLFLCVGGFICGVCFVIVCSSSVLLLVLQEDCAP